MRQVLMQRGSHSFIRYCASESVFAGLRRIAKLATSIAIAVAFSGIALPTSSAQAQTARFSVTGQFTPGQTTFAENEEASFILRLDGFPDDQDIATAEVELVVQQITTGFSTPQGNTFEGTFFDVVVEGDNSRAVTLSVGGGANNRIKAIVAFDPDDSTAGVGQPAVITWTIRPKDIASTQTFRIRRTNNGRVVLKNSAGVAVSRLAPTFLENFTITPVIAEDAVFVTYTYQNGDTIPGVKREEPTNTSEVGVDWNPAVGINLLAGATATYSDGTAYECDAASSGNCQIRFPGGQIANGGPVNATFPEESAPPAPTIPTPPPPVEEVRLNYPTYQNLDVIPEHLFKSEEPTNASDTGITWADGESLTLTKDTTARYDDGTNYKCLSNGGCVITFASRQINNGGQVQISQSFEVGTQQFIQGTSAAILFNTTPPTAAGIPGPEVRAGNQDAQAITRPRARTIPENHGTDAGQANHTGGVPAFQVALSGLPSGVTASCVYGLGGGALYLGDDDENPTHGDYVLVNGGTEVPLGDLSQPGPRDDADVNHFFTTPCNPDALTPWNIRIIDDTIDEQNEVIRIILKSMTLFVTVGSNQEELGSVRVDQPDTLALTIADNDATPDPTLPILSLSEGGSVTTTVAEGATAIFYLNVDKTTANDVAFDYSISGTAVAASDFSTPTVGSGFNSLTPNAPGSIGTQVNACSAIADHRCGVIILNNDNPVFATDGTANQISIATLDDSLAESNERVILTLYPRVTGTHLDQRTSIVDAASRFRSFTIPANGTAPSVTLTGETPVDEGSNPNISITLAAGVPTSRAITMGYRITGVGIESTDFTRRVQPQTTPITNFNADGDLRTGTFTFTGANNDIGGLTFNVAVDTVLEGTETFTLTLYAGHPDSTNLALAGGTFNTDITDTTNATARLTWPGTTTRTGGEQRDSRGDASSPIGESVFPGGVLEGASPHVLLDLHVTGTPGTPVTVGRDLFFPISCRRMTGTSTFSTPNCGPLGLDIRIESINDDKGTSARSDDTIVHGFFIRAGRSQEATGINIVPDANAEPDETFVFNTGNPIEFRGQDTPVGIDARVTPFATDASLTVHDRPVDAGDITWMPEDPAQADFGAGLTKIADLVITLPGGFTADHSAVTVDYEYNGSDALGSISFRDPDNTSTIYATREVILRNEDDDVIGTRERITVVRTSFSKADPGSDPTATVGLYFSPAASGSGEQPTVDIKKVSHVDLLTVSFDRDLCNDGLPGEAPGSDLCANQQFGVGVPMVEFPSAGRVLAASEAGPVVGSVPFRIFTSSTPEENFFPDSVDATIGFTLGGTARRGLSPNSRDYVLSVLRSDNPDGTGNPADITPAFTSANAGTVPLADGNRAQYVIFRVTPNADGINEGTETVEIRVSDVTFSDAGSTTDIAVNRGQTVRIANELVAEMEFSSTYNLFRLDTVEGATNRRGRNLAGGDNSSRHRVASVRLRVKDIPTDAFYADISYQVDPASTATERSQAGGGATEDYTIARPSFVTGSFPDGTTGLGTSNTVTIDRENGDGLEIDNDDNDINNLDYWLNIIDDSIVEPPETVIMNLTATFFPCASGLNGANDSCTGGRGSQQVGPTIPFSFTFLINDNDGAVTSLNIVAADDPVNEDARSASDRDVEIQILTINTRRLDNGQTIYYNVTDASGGAITDNALGVTAADFIINPGPNDRIPGRGDRFSECRADDRTPDQITEGVVICRGTITTHENTHIVRLKIAEDSLGENEEAFYVNFEPVTLNRAASAGGGTQDIPAGLRALVTIADSDGGGPPPILGPTAALATTGEREIVDDIGETILTLQITEIPSDPAIARAKATLEFGNTPGFAIATPGSDMVQGTNYDVAVAIATPSNLATTLVGTDKIVAEFDFPGGDAPVLTYTIAANDITPPHEFSVNIDSVEFLNSTLATVTLDPVIAQVGEPQTLRIVEPPAPLEVTVAVREAVATEATNADTDPGIYRISLEELSTAGDTTVTFTVADRALGVAGAGNCSVNLDTDGNCSTFAGGGEEDYYLATHDGTNYVRITLATDTSLPGNPIAGSVDIRGDQRSVDVFVLPTIDTRSGDNRDSTSETVTLTLARVDNGFTVAASPGNAAIVNIVDPGNATLSRSVGADTLALGGENRYLVNLENVGVSDGRRPNPNSGHGTIADRRGIVNQPIRNHPDGVEIDAVVELTFPNNTITTPLPTDFANPIIGDNYNILLAVPVDADYTITSAGNVLRIVVPQTRLRQLGNATGSGNFEGNERFLFNVISKTVAGAVPITMNAYTVEAGETDLDTLANRLTAPVEAVSGNSFSVVAAPVVTFTSTLADDRVIAGTQGVVANNPLTPETAADPDALQINITNPFATQLSSAVVEHTLRIAPTAGTATEAFNGEITIIPDPDNQNIMTVDSVPTLQGAVVTFTTPDDDANAREFNVRYTTFPTLPANGQADDDATLNISLGATVFGGDDKRYTISLVNTRIEDSAGDVLANGPGAPEQPLDVVVPASDLPTATLTVTGPLEIEDDGDATLGGLDTTTFEVSLENITPGAADTAMIVAVAFDGTAASNAFSRGADTNSNYLGVSTVNEVLYLMLDDDAFTDNEETIPVEFYLVPANAAVDETIIPRIVSANFYTESDDSGSNLLRAQDFALAITANSLPAANATTSVAAGNIINGDEADRTFTVVAEGEAPLVSLSPSGTNELIADNSGSFAELTISLANLPATIATSPTTTATVGSVRVTLALDPSGNLFEVTPNGKTIYFVDRFVRLQLPSEPAGLLFLNETEDDEAQVIIPAGTTEAVITVTVPGSGGQTDNIRIAGIAWYDDAPTPEEITSGVPVVHTAGVFTVLGVSNPVVANLSADGPTTIGTGGGDRGMTEFSLTLTNLQNGNVAEVPVTFGSIDDPATPNPAIPSREESNTQVDGENYTVDIIETTGDGTPAAATFIALAGEIATVGLTAAAAGEATVRFRITSKTSNALNFTVSLGTGIAPFTVTTPVSGGPDLTRNEVVQTASLAYEIIAAGDVRSVSFDPDTVMVDGDGVDTETTTLTLSNIPIAVGITDVDHVDIELMATGLTFNQADGRAITLGDNAATLTIASTLDHKFINTTVGSSTAILQVNRHATNGLENSTITVTGGFVNSDMEFTLRPRDLVYYSTAPDAAVPATLDGPGADEVHFLPATFRVDAMEASAAIATDQTTIVMNDVGGGEAVITLANLPLGGFKLSDDSFHAVESLVLQVSFGEDNGDFEFGSGSLPDDESVRLAITGISNAEDYDIAYNGANVLSIVIPRSRLLASTGDNSEAQGFEEITINFTAKTVNSYAVGVLGNLIGDGTALAPVVDGETAIAFNPAAVTFTVAAQGTATLTAPTATTAEATSPTAGEFVLTLAGAPANDTEINYVIPIGDGDATPGVDYTLTVPSIPADHFDITVPEINSDGNYMGTITVNADAITAGTVGEAAVTISVTPIDDNIVEDTETVTLTLPDGVPGVDYTADNPAIEVEIADNDVPVVLVGVNGELLENTPDPIAGIREGLTYPVQLFIKDFNALDPSAGSGGYSDVTLVDDNNLVLAEEATFTLSLNQPTSGIPVNERADVTGADADVSFSDSAGGNLAETATIMIPAGEFTGLAYITIRDEDDATDANEKFEILVASNEVDASNIRATDGDIIIDHEAEAGLCEGRTPAVRTAIRNLIQTGTTPAYTGTNRNPTACADITSTDLQGIITLDLSSATLTSLQPGDFAGLTSLTTLNLSDNNLRALPATVFPAELEDNLTSLDLSGNSLTALPANVFDNLAGTYNAQTEVTVGGVGTIDLSGNSLTAAGLPDDVFDDLVALETLNLGDNDTLTSLPVGLLDKGTANSGALFDLMSLTLPSAVQGRVNFATNAVTLTQGGTATVTVEIVDAENGNPLSMPISLFIQVRTVDGVSVNNTPPIGDGNNYNVSPGFIIIPAGESSVDVTFTASATAAVSDRNIAFDFSSASTTSMVVPNVGTTSNFVNYPSSNVHGTGEIEDVRNALFRAGTTNTIAVTVVEPVALDPTTATAAELNNVAATVQLNLGRTAADVGTADVTFELSGGDGLGTDYNLAITDPDGNAVNNTSDSELVLAVGATTGTFRLPADVSAATFTLTPIADGFPSTAEGNEVITITITEVDYNGAAAPDATPGLTVAATVTIMDNTAAPAVAVTATAPGAGDTELTEGSADGRGTFTIDLSAAPEGEATVFYTLAVDDETDPNVAFDAIDQIRLTGLGGERPVNPEDTTTPNASPRVFTMNVASGAAMGSLAFTAANDADQVGESVVFTVTGVTFADDGDGTDIGAVAPATISIVDATPDSSICTRTQQVYEAILGELPESACENVMNSADLTSITSLSVTDNDLTSLKAGDFAGLTGMTSLTIDGELTELPAGVFNALSSLATLDLSDNDLGRVDGTVFGTTNTLQTLRTLNLSGSTSLDITAGTLDTVLSRLDDLTWPTTRTARFPAGTSIIVEQDGTANVPVQLNAPLPVAVSIPVTVTAAGVTATAAAVIPAGQIGPEDAVITAVSATETTTGRITIGVPVLQTTPATGNPVNINPTPADSVRDALVTRDRTAASLNVIAPTGPTARLVGPGRSLGLGGTANFSVVLSNIDGIIDPAFTHVEVAVELGGAGIAGDLALVPSDVDSVETSDYRIDITSGNVVTAAGDTAVDTEVMGGSPAALYVYVPRGEFDALDGGSGDAAGAETINFTLTIKDDAGFSLTTTPNTLMPSLRFASNGNSTVRAVNANASLGDVINGDITVIGTDLTYSITAPFTVSPAIANITEGGSQRITLTLTNAASGTVTIPYSVGGGATVMTDYTIDPTTPAAFVITSGLTATITVRAVSDRVVDDDKTVTISLTTGTYPGGGADMFTGSGALVSTVNIDDADTAPTGVTVTANPERINETGNTTQSIITVRLDQPALALMGVSLMYTIIGTATLSTDGTCSADNNADYTAAIVGGTTITSATPEMPGTLTFAAGTPGAGGSAGDREKRITVTACEDEEDESDDPDETVTFTIRAADAMNLTLTADVSTTITIREITVIPQDVMDQVETVATVVATEHVSALTTLIRQRFSVTSSFGSPPRVPTGTVPAPSTTTNLALADNPENMNDMINSMGLERTAQGDSNNQYAVWIRGQRSVFEGTPEIRGLTVDYDGSSTGIGMGAEYSSGGYLAGLAMNYVTTEVDISSDSEGETISKYEESIVIAAPYFSLKAGDGTSLWASFGVGSGTADAKLATQTKSADVSLTFLNAGADFTVIGRSFEVVTGLSGLAIRKVVDSFTFTDPEHVLPKTTIDTMQAVGEVTIYRPIPIAGQIVRPYMGISTIHDFGDIVADDDHGLGIRSGVTFGVGRISADIELSSELLRENRRQWTVSGGARFASRPGGQGLSLSLDGTQETQMDTGESVDDDAAQTWGIGLEGGYGMPMGLFHPNGLLTPFTSIDQTGDGRDMSGGMRLSVGNGLSLDLETTRQMHDDSEDASEHKAGLRGQWSF